MQILRITTNVATVNGGLKKNICLRCISVERIPETFFKVDKKLNRHVNCEPYESKRKNINIPINSLLNAYPPPSFSRGCVFRFFKGVFFFYGQVFFCFYGKSEKAGIFSCESFCPSQTKKQKPLVLLVGELDWLKATG